MARLAPLWQDAAAAVRRPARLQGARAHPPMPAQGPSDLNGSSRGRLASGLERRGARGGGGGRIFGHGEGQGEGKREGRGEGQGQ